MQSIFSRKKNTALTAAQKKPINHVTALEQEQRVMMQELNHLQIKQSDAQQELMRLLSEQRKAAAIREPLCKAHEQAQTALRESTEALSRHLGKPMESEFSDRLYTAEEQARKAQEALADADTQQDRSKGRIPELRVQMTTLEQGVQEQQSRIEELQGKLEQAHEQERRHGLIRLLTAYQDLLMVFESDGEKIAHMRVDDPGDWASLFRDLSIDHDQLFDLISPIHLSSDLSQNGGRPFLVERQNVINARLAKLKA